MLDSLTPRELLATAGKQSFWNKASCVVRSNDTVVLRDEHGPVSTEFRTRMTLHRFMTREKTEVLGRSLLYQKGFSSR